MKRTVYIETSVISYLTARPSRDLIVAAHQDITREWWERRRLDFETFVSGFVLEEAIQGDIDAAKRRTDMLTELDELRTRSLSDLKEIGCKSAWTVHISPIFWSIE